MLADPNNIPPPPAAMSSQIDPIPSAPPPPPLHLMPDCAEKSLCLLHSYLNGIQSVATTSLYPSLPIPSGVQATVTQLKKQMQSEQWLNELPISLMLADLEKNLNSSDLQPASNLIVKMLEEIRPLDIALIRQSINDTKIAAEKIKDKDVILLLGVTGVGKSTTIHFLAGSTMQQTQIDGLDHIAPSVMPLPELSSFTTTPFTYSETKSINAVEIPSLFGSIVLCDSPGFEDTDGAEKDIINGIGVARAVRSCKSVRPLILISRNGVGEKWEGVTQLLQTLVKLMPALKNHLPTFSYLFTKFTKTEQVSIHLKLINKSKHLTANNRSDPVFLAVLEDMITKTTPSARVLNPLTDASAELLNSLMQAPAITNPTEVFKDFVTQSSLNKLKQQFVRCRFSISSALRRFDVNLLKYKLDQLQGIELDIPEAMQAYQDCVGDTSRFILDFLADTFQKMDKFLQNGNTFSESELMLCRNAILNLKQFDEVRLPHLLNLPNLTTECNQRLDRYQAALVEQIKNNPFKPEVAVIHLEKLLLFAKVFGNNNYFNEACSFIHETFQRHLNEAMRLIGTHSYKEYAEAMDCVKSMAEHFARYLTNTDLALCYAETNSRLIQSLQEITNNTLRLFSKDPLAREDTDTILSTLNIITNAQDTTDLHVHVVKKIITAIQERLLQEVITYFGKIRDKIASLCATPNAAGIESIKTYLALMRSLFVGKQINSQSIISQIYSDAMSQFKALAVPLQKDAIQILDLLIKSQPIDSNAFFQILSQLSTLGAQKELSSVADCLKQCLENIKTQVDNTKLDFADQNNIIVLYEKIKQVKKLTQLYTVVPEIKGIFIPETSTAIIDRIVVNFTAKINGTLQNIQGIFSSSNKIILSNIYLVIGYIGVCRSIQEPEIFKQLRAAETSTAHFSESTLKGVQKQLAERFPQNFKDTINSLTCLKNLRDFYKDALTHPVLNIDLYHQFFNAEPERIMNEWSARASHYASELLAELPTLKEHSKFNILYKKMCLAKDLSTLDSFLNSEPKFSTVALTFKSAITTQVIAIIKSGRDYATLPELIEILKTNNPDLKGELKEIGQELITTFQQSLESVKNKVQAIRLPVVSLNSLPPLIDELRNLYQSQPHVLRILNYLKEKSSSDFGKILNIISTEVTHKIASFLENANTHIVNHEFHEAEQIVTATRATLESLPEILPSNMMKTLEQAIKAKKEQSQEAVNREIKKYNSLDLNKFEQNRPDLLLHQLELARGDDPFYVKIQAQLTVLIQTQITKFLHNIDPNQIEKSTAQIDYVTRQVTQYLPTLNAALAPELRQCQKYVQTARELCIKELNETSATGNIRKMTDIMVSEANKQHYWKMEQARLAIKKALQAVQPKFDAALSSNNLVIIFGELAKTWEDFSYYIIKLSALKLPSSADVKVRSLYSDDDSIEIYATFITQSSAIFNQSLAEIEVIREINPKAFAIIAAHFSKLESFLKLKQNAPSFYQALLRINSNLEERVQCVFTKIQECFETQERLFNDQLGQGNFIALKPILDIMKSRTSLFSQVQTYVTSPLAAQTPQFACALQNCKSYEAMQSMFKNKCLALSRNIQQPFLCPSTQTPNASDRNDFYKKICRTYLSLKAASSLTDHIDLGTIEKQCDEYFIGELNRIAAQLTDSINNQFPGDEKLYVEFNINYDNLRAFRDCFERTPLAQIAQNLMADVDINFGLKLKKLCDAAREGSALEKVADAFIDLKSLAINIPVYKNQVNEAIDRLLLYYKESAEESQKIGELGLILNGRAGNLQGVQDGIAQMLVNEHSAFQGYSIYLRNTQTLRFTIDHVLDTKAPPDNVIRGINISAEELRRQYDLFDHEYWEQLVVKGLENPYEEASKKKLANEAREVALSAIPYKNKIRSLMAHVFACWTLSNSKAYLAEAAKPTPGSNAKDRKYYLLQPHAAQVVAIFRFFGLDANINTNEVKITSDFNHLIQIKTGEGKSITLAVTAIVLALMGYSVDCVCYSEYLSERDHDAFRDLFKAFGVNDFINYGTFNQMCEDFIDQHGKVRKLVEEMIAGVSTTTTSTEPSRPRVLLIDEVDVFFNKDFYGNTYRPLARVTDPTVTALINYIWNNRNNSGLLRLASIQSSSAYVECCKKFPNWEPLILESVKTMLLDLRSFESQEYIVMNDQIGYKEQDTISFRIAYGYKTLFLYYKEMEAGKISRVSLESKISLLIDCGSFSYAEVPKQYQCVMGVTGTLDTLIEPERRILETVYNIHKSTYMPSVYGPNQLEFPGNSSSGVMIEDERGYFIKIQNEISRIVGENRAVLVFFASNQKLKIFHDWQKTQARASGVKVINEETPTANRESLVRKAVTPKSVTLLTREFGRGTDFICYDEHLIRNGGVHVIQTFVSDEVSEETQIMGRTARQGNKGSFSMILLNTDLERFHITPEDITTMRSNSKFYDTINGKRCIFFEQQYQENVRHVVSSTNEHVIAMRFLSSLIAHDITASRTFLLAKNEAIGFGELASRTICLMDATGSMTSLIEKTKHTVQTMFEQAYTMLRDWGIKSTFEMQFAVYRNYDCPEETLLQVSPWETQAANLHTFVDSISAHSGTWQEEAIEIALSHANREAKKGLVTQVILIGDAPPNKREQVEEGRAKKGESYWVSTKFAIPTYYEEEVAQLKARGIKVHAFFVDPAASAKFQEIASNTGGGCESLDIESPAGAEKLTNLVTGQVMNDIGGLPLVEAYKVRFCKGYIAGSSSSFFGSAKKQGGTSITEIPAEGNSQTVTTTVSTSKAAPASSTLAVIGTAQTISPPVPVPSPAAISSAPTTSISLSTSSASAVTTSSVPASLTSASAPVRPNASTTSSALERGSSGSCLPMSFAEKLRFFDGDGSAPKPPITPVPQYLLPPITTPKS